MTTVPVNASRQYDIRIGTGLLDRAGAMLREVVPCETVMLVCGDIVNGLYADRVQASLEDAGYRVARYVYPHGEQSKNADTYFALLNALAQAGLTRTDAIAALGGGVTGDVSGFAAATYQRGISYIQIPTTLLAAVDSSVGGKTAIDLPAGKNLAGAFYQPGLVLCDYDTLNTLPEEVFTDGCAEVIKYGVIWDADFFEQLKSPIRPQIESVIARCVEIKRDVVQQDEFDTGARQLLNLGHTIGHGIEACSGYQLSHGKAVAIGMTLITRAAVSFGLCPAETLPRLQSLLKKYCLPDATEYGAQALYEKTLSDKKRTGSTIRLVVPTAWGRSQLHQVAVPDLLQWIEKGLSL